MNNYFERPAVLNEMDEDVWSQSEATPVVQHFPDSKNTLPTANWQALNPSATFDPPVNHMMIDPLLLGSGAAYPPMHAEMPREELMYAMNGMSHQPASSTRHMATMMRSCFCVLRVFVFVWKVWLTGSRHAHHPRSQWHACIDPLRVRQHVLPDALPASWKAVLSSQLWLCRHWIPAIRSQRKLVTKQWPHDCLQIPRSEASNTAP